MTLRERDLSAMPSDIAAIGEQVLGAEDPYRVIGEQLADLVEDAQFAGLYEPRVVRRCRRRCWRW